LVVAYKFSVEFSELVEDPIEYFHGPSMLENFVSFGSCVLIFVTTGLRIAKIAGVSNIEDGAESIVLCLTSLFLSLYIYFFFLGIYLTGPFIVMVQKMIRTDVARWLLIFVVLVLCFTNALFALQFHGNDSDIPIVGIDGWFYMLNHNFQILTGGFETDVITAASHVPYVSTVLAIVYAIIVVILLLNILIAMMNKTFEDVWSSASIRWILERGKIVHSIQSEMSDIYNNPNARYWVELQASQDELECANCTLGSDDIKHKGVIRRIMNIHCKWRH